MYQNLSFRASKIQPSDGPTIKISYGQQDSATLKIPIMLLNIGGWIRKAKHVSSEESSSDLVLSQCVACL